MRFPAVLGAFATVLAVAACSDTSVHWRDPVELHAPTTSVRLMVNDSGRATLVPDTITAMLPASPGACATSARATRGSTRLYAVWWRPRPDSGIGLYSASSSDGGRTWSTPTIIDTATVDTRGCDRPAPAVATVGDDLYVAYSMNASEGMGVFFAHFMGGMLHSPVGVIYGQRLVATAIATHGSDDVAVAYEEPNGSRAQVDLALSTTQGHIFEQHGAASRDVDVAHAPLVALGEHYVAVAWRPGAPPDTGIVVTRVGRLP